MTTAVEKAHEVAEILADLKAECVFHNYSFFVVLNGLDEKDLAFMRQIINRAKLERKEGNAK